MKPTHTLPLSAFVLIVIFLTPAAAHASDDAVSRGREAYMSYGCAVCHGKNGEGDGLSSRGMYPPPTNFHKPQTFTRGHDKDSIRHSIAFGVKEENSVMPAFSHIPQNELADLAAYLVSLQADKQEGVKVVAARVQPMPPSVMTTAAYLVLENPGDKEAVLVSASTGVARVTEIHQMVRKDGMMRMGMVKELAVPARGTLDFEHEGYHLMLIDVNKFLKKGEAVPLTLRFKDGQTLQAEATVHEE